MATSKEELQIIMTAKDEASAKIKSMSGSLDGLKTALGAIGKAGIVAFGALSTAAVVSFKDFVEAEKETALANSILQKTLDGMTEKQWQMVNGNYTLQDTFTDLKATMEGVSSAALKLGFDDEAASVAFAKLYQSSQDVDQAMSDLALAEDLARFKAVDLETAALAVAKAHAGSTKELKAMGIEIKDGATAMENLAILQSKVGGTAETMSNTVAIKLEVLNQSFGNLKESVGGAVATAITPFIDKMAEWASDPAIQEKIKDIINGFMLLAMKIAEVSGVIIKFTYEAVVFLTEKIITIYEWIRNLIVTLDENTGFITILRDAWDSVSVMFNERLLPALQELWTALKPLQPFLEMLAKIIGVILYGAVVAFIQIVKVGLIVYIEALTRVITIVTKSVESFKAFWDGLIDTLAKVIVWIDKTIEAIKRLNIIESAKNAISGFLGFGGGKAAGGAVSSNKAYVVGERGAELFVPTSNGTIIPNAGGSVGGGVTIVINGDVTGEDAVDKLSAKIVERLGFNTQLAT